MQQRQTVEVTTTLSRTRTELAKYFFDFVRGLAKDGWCIKVDVFEDGSRWDIKAEKPHILAISDIEED